ncbi:hypothetical protein OG746_00345 [Streptomyces sp. NBC_01016]|uniref:hypothetical protein n=1 Tax=Streptomyces sp. NBC_01016 TaxID=2903720 RepID=UPI0022573CFC|nr:hypothetical protein [Streptomyces sp. NBC_01016]MCX4827191.1 hypothetical protein [Streptomyces sp. NBC_01016]
MAFPEDPLGLRVEIKAGRWTDITGDVYTRDAITHTRGIRSGSTTAEPASVPLTINNRDGRYSPRNPMSPYYGLIGRNTPVRLSLPGGGHFLDLDGDPANYASTPDTSALDITGDIDLRIELSASWYRPGVQMLLGKWGASGNRSYLMRIADGRLYFFFSLDGTVNYSASQPLPALPERAALRVTFDADNGAGQWAVDHFWAPTLDGPWTQIGKTFTNGTAPSAPVVLFSGPAPLAVGPSDLSLNRLPFEGKAYRAEVRSGINGTIVAAPNFTQRPVGTAPFTDSAGRSWSFSGTAAVADRRDLFVGEIASWPQKWVGSGADVWTSVQAAGILRRYGQGVKALDSTLRRRIPSGDPVAYWPMEEDQGATRAYSPIKGVTPAALTGVEFGALDTLPSSDPLPKISSSGGTLSAIVPAHADLGQWQVELVYNADGKAPPESGDYAEVMGVSATGTVRRLVVSMRADRGRIQGFDASGAALFTLTALFQYVAPFDEWHRLRAWAREEGDGTCTWQVSWENVTGRVQYRFFTTAGSAGHVTAVTATWGKELEGWSVGHLSVLPTADNALYNGSDTAYAGETAWARMQRLAFEEGLSISRIAGELTTQQVGPQRPEALLDLLQEAADADGGMLVESRDRLGVLYRDRSSLYTQEPALVLDYAAGQIAADSLEPTADDDATRNDITVSRTGGSSARSLLEEGPLSVLPPPAGIGLYDESVTLNVDDDQQLEYIAPWRLHLGTYDGARYPSVAVRLHKHPELIDAVLRLREGDILRILNLPSWVAYGPVDLLITGLTETYKPRTWEITFTCDPGGPWMTARADHAVYGKADTGGSELAGPVSATDTALAVRTTVGAQWTDAPRETPFDVALGGEVVRVNTVGRTILPADPFFESGIVGWDVENSTLAWDQSVTHPRGTTSLKITPNGASAVAGASSALSAADSIVPGQAYRAGMWVYCPVALTDVQPTLYWHNAAGTYLSTGGPNTGAAVPANQWTWVEATVTAPANATRGKMRPRFGGTPAAQPIYVWAPRAVTPTGQSVSDTFTRAVTGGWGKADTGQVWAWTGGSAGDYAVNGSVGQHVMNTRNVLRYMFAPSPSADVDVRADWALDKVAVGDSTYAFLMARYTDTNHFYFARAQVAPAGNIVLTLRKRNGAEAQLGGSYTVPSFAAGTYYTLRLQVIGSTIRAKCWLRSATEPEAWQLSETDTDLTAMGSVGVRSLLGTSSTQALPVTASFDNFQVTDSQTFTVTRSLNGVVKPHTAGTPLSLAHPAIASL